MIKVVHPKDGWCFGYSRIGAIGVGESANTDSVTAFVLLGFLFVWMACHSSVRYGMCSS